MKISPAKANHAQVLTALAQRSKAHWGYSNEFMQACAGELTHSEQGILNNPTYVAIEHKKPVGFYMLCQLSRHEVELESLFIEPLHIGSGLGRILFEHAVKTAVDLGYRQMQIQSDPYAAPFYLKMGCVQTGIKKSLSIPGRSLPLLSLIF